MTRSSGPPCNAASTLGVSSVDALSTTSTSASHARAWTSACSTAWPTIPARLRVQMTVLCVQERDAQCARGMQRPHVCLLTERTPRAPVYNN